MRLVATNRDKCRLGPVYRFDSAECLDAIARETIRFRGTPVEKHWSTKTYRHFSRWFATADEFTADH